MVTTMQRTECIKSKLKINTTTQMPYRLTSTAVCNVILLYSTTTAATMIGY